MDAPTDVIATMIHRQVAEGDAPERITRRQLEDVFDVDERTLRNHLPKLECAGTVEVLEQGGGRACPTVYWTENVVPALAASLGKLPRSWPRKMS